MTTLTLDSLPPRLLRFLPSIADFFGRSPSIVPHAMNVATLAVDAAERHLEGGRHGSVTQLDLARPQPDAPPTEPPVLAPAPGLLVLPMALNEASTEFAEVAEPEVVTEGVRDSTPAGAMKSTLTIVPDGTDEVRTEPPRRFPHAPLCELGPWYWSPPSPEQTLLAMREEELRAARLELVEQARTKSVLETQLVVERRQHEQTRAERDLAMDRVGELEGIEAEVAASSATRREADSYFEELTRVQFELDAASAAVAATRRELASMATEIARSERSFNRPQTPLQALELVGRIYSDRLTILPAALKSARRSAFEDGLLVFESLALIVMMVRSGSDPHHLFRLCNGRQARSRAKESKFTERTFEQSRTFLDLDGERVVMTAHVTLGHGVRSGATLQIYFTKTGDGSVVIGHCGDHLPTFGENT